MSSESAQYGEKQFRQWLKNRIDDGEQRSVSLAFFNWLGDGGLKIVGEQYGSAVEVVLLVLSSPDPIGLPIITSEDDCAWDYMTESGFRLEVYHHTYGVA